MGVKSSVQGPSPTRAMEVPSETRHVVPRPSVGWLPSAAPARTWVGFAGLCLLHGLTDVTLKLGTRVGDARPHPTGRLGPNLILGPGPCSPGGRPFSSAKEPKPPGSPSPWCRREVGPARDGKGDYLPAAAFGVRSTCHLDVVFFGHLWPLPRPWGQVDLPTETPVALTSPWHSAPPGGCGPWAAGEGLAARQSLGDWKSCDSDLNCKSLGHHGRSQPAAQLGRPGPPCGIFRSFSRISSM